MFLSFGLGHFWTMAQRVIGTWYLFTRDRVSVCSRRISVLQTLSTRQVYKIPFQIDALEFCKPGTRRDGVICEPNMFTKFHIPSFLFRYKPTQKCTHCPGFKAVYTENCKPRKQTDFSPVTNDPGATMRVQVEMSQLGLRFQIVPLDCYLEPFLQERTGDSVEIYQINVVPFNEIISMSSFILNQARTKTKMYTIFRNSQIQPFQ